MSSSEPAFHPPKALRAIAPLLFGITMLMGMMDNPRLAALHTTDILKLTGAGSMIGIGMVSVGMYIRERYGRKP